MYLSSHLSVVSFFWMQRLQIPTRSGHRLVKLGSSIQFYIIFFFWYYLFHVRVTVRSEPRAPWVELLLRCCVNQLFIKSTQHVSHSASHFISIKSFIITRHFELSSQGEKKPHSDIRKLIKSNLWDAATFIMAASLNCCSCFSVNHSRSVKPDGQTPRRLLDATGRIEPLTLNSTGAACVTHRMTVWLFPSFTATLIQERSSSEPATFFLLLRGCFGGLQISRSALPLENGNPSGDWSTGASITQHADCYWTRAPSLQNWRRHFRPMYRISSTVVLADFFELCRSK